MDPALSDEFEALEAFEVESSSIWSNVLELFEVFEVEFSSIRSNVFDSSEVLKVVAPVLEVSSVVEPGLIPPIACRAFCAFVCNVAKALCASERLPELSALETDFKSSVSCFGAVTPLEDRLF